MASKFSFLSSIIERKKPKENTDELAVVKAAAWAWYQHGSGSEGKATSEFDVTRTHRANRPSRYKLEAMRMAKEGSQIHTKKPLLDPYEVQSISRQLDSLIESNHNKLENGTDNCGNASLDIGGRRTKKKIRKWFWLRHGAVCGRGDDVIDPRALRDGGRRQPTKRVPAVKCLPLANTNGAL
ncbi:uncharacterized protein LOC133316863 [Gastrolobium bilobum]|uniref:uncharacterized protein LOC133316863 n=1 Tax=Gastrolobium bilobum TaxID=150636 RepID=UPI002AAFDB44|nr:uncharacterized protein LOC133316863 [Gastrolobium bilobum]